MCAPTRDLAKIAAIAAVAYASGGSSLFASSTTAAATSTATAANLATTSLAIPTTVAGQTAAGLNLSGMFSTIGTFAKYATPIIGAAGQIYSGVINANLLKSKANFVDYSITMDMEASALRKIRRQRLAAEAIGKQRAKFGLTGVTLEGTPTDVLEETSATFAEDQFVDDFNTSGKLYSKQITALGLRQESQAAMLSGIVGATTTIANRGLLFPSPAPKTKSPYTAVDTGLTATEGSF
jgi:hypothetical protein